MLNVYKDQPVRGNDGHSFDDLTHILHETNIFFFVFTRYIIK
jgi:hypothetical protein